MAALALPKQRAARSGAGPLGLGVATLWLSVVVLLPLTALLVKSIGSWDAITTPAARAALVLTVAIIDLPFALPTIVASIVLLALYGPHSPIGLDLYATRPALVVALAFVTLPFVVRSVQPVLMEVDREAEEAAASLGANGWTSFRRIVLPALYPALLGGAGLAFARALGEFGSVVLIGGGIPRKTQVASQYIAQQIEIDRPASAAAVSVALLAISFAVLFVLRRLAR
jgi:sulfate transport system permease protein